MPNKQEYYIEFWTVGDRIKTPEGATFSIHPTSLKYFLNRLIGKSKRTIVYLMNTATKQVVIDRKQVVVVDRYNI